MLRPKGSTRFRRWTAIPMMEVSFTLELWAREAVPKWNDVRAFMKHLAVDLASRLSINGTKLEQSDAIDTATHLYNQSKTSVNR